jgi:hypothetical protein
MKPILISSLLVICFAVTVFSQADIYTTSGAEIIFSFADINQAGGGGSTNLRFAPVINLQTTLHRDFSEKFGLFSGIAVRNVGYRMDEYRDPSNNISYEKAFRSYNLGIPIGFKVGQMDKLFFYAGYEIELGFLYKEKTYEDGDKINKITGWFSSRQNIWQSSLMAGVQLPYGANIKFKYYLTEFHNRDYTNSSGIKPYADLDSQVFFFSLSFMLFRDAEIYIYSH